MRNRQMFMWDFSQLLISCAAKHVRIILQNSASRKTYLPIYIDSRKRYTRKKAPHLYGASGISSVRLACLAKIPVS